MVSFNVFPRLVAIHFCEKPVLKRCHTNCWLLLRTFVSLPMVCPYNNFKYIKIMMYVNVTNLLKY